MSINRLTALTGLACVAGAAAVHPGSAQESTVLSLDQAFSNALGASPHLLAAAEANRAASAAILQADRRPNPTVDAELENFGGTDRFQAFDQTEAMVGFSQRLELGGDRQARTRLAMRDADAVRLQGDASRQDLLYEVELAYIAVQRSEAERAQAEARLALAQEISRAVDRRVEAARDPVMAGARSLTLVADAQIDVDRERLQSLAARERLASYWLGDPDFSVNPSFFELPASAPVVDPVAKNPAIAQSLALQHRAEAVVDVERARARPDPIISAGARWFSEFDEPAFVVGVSIPLTLWDNNSGNVAKASAERQRAMHETEALRQSLQRDYASTRSQLEAARAEVETIDARLIPVAERAARAASDGYTSGGFSYLDVLDAQHALSQARKRRISALYSYHHARATLARLSGGYLHSETIQEHSR